MKRGVGTLAAALYLATASPAFAHHSHPLTYDWCKSITVEGRVESVEYKNPHSIIVVRQDDGTAIDPWLIRRVGDTFSWGLQPSPNPANCAGIFRTPARTAGEALRGR
jgi:hypothetical protein